MNIPWIPLITAAALVAPLTLHAETLHAETPVEPVTLTVYTDYV